MPTGSEILGWIKDLQQQQPYKRDDCPKCGWTLEEHPQKGLHCPLCGWTEQVYHKKTIDEP